MLTAIRNKASSWVVKILFAVLILAFAVWGIGDIFTRQDLGEPVLTVGEADYNAQQFRRDLERRLEQMQRQGVSLTAEQFAQLGGVAQIVRETADRMLLDAYADRIGVQMPQSAAVIDIQRNTAFAGLGGAFDRERFMAVLRQNGMSEAGFVESIRAEMTRQHLVEAATAGVMAPSVLVDRIRAYREETRTAETLVIPDVSMTGIAEPDRAALEAFHKENGESYRRPEYRAGFAVHLKAEDFTKDVTITEDEITQEFADRAAEFSSPETRVVQQVVIPDEAKAQAIAAAVAAGKPFADAAREATGSEPVDLGTVIKEQLPKEIADRAFQLAPGATSEPIKSAFGWHVVNVGAVTPASSKSIEDVKEQLRQEMALARAGDSLISIVNQLDDGLGAGTGLDEVARSLKLPVAELTAVDPDGKDKDGKPVPLAPEVLALVQSTDVGSTSQVEALSDGTFAVVQITGLTPSEIKPLDEVLNQVKADWLNDARRKAAGAKAKELAEKLKTVGDLSVIAKEIGQTIKVSAPFRRNEDSAAAGIDRALAGSLFVLKIGETAIGRTTDGAVLARLSGVQPAKPDAEAGKALSEQLAKAIQSDLTQQFLGALEQSIPVVRHDDVVQGIIAQPQP